MSTSRISELAQRIATNTAKIDTYLISQGLPQPSFALDAPFTSVIPENEVELKKARQEVLADTLELRSLIQGPREYMSSFSVSFLNFYLSSALCTDIRVGWPYITKTQRICLNLFDLSEEFAPRR